MTQHETEYLIHRWGIDEKKLWVIGVGIEVDTDPTPPGQKRLRKLLGISETAPVIAFVGQHGLHKGIETLLLAMPLVWNRFPRARVIIAGGVSLFTDAFKELSAFIDNQNQNHTKNNINENKKEKRVFFLDNIDEQLKSDILSGCDIFTTPSGFESFGITILEAWKCKKPVVACRIPATMNLIEEYETGVLVDYKNARELAGALKELIADPDLRKTMGEKGYQKLIKKYSWNVVGKQYHEFYREVLGYGR